MLSLHFVPFILEDKQHLQGTLGQIEISVIFGNHAHVQVDLNINHLAKVHVPTQAKMFMASLIK